MTRPSTPSARPRRPFGAQGPRDTILRGQLGTQRNSVGKAVGSFVPRLAQKAFEKYGFSTIALLTDWPAIVGKELAQFTKPERLKWPRSVPIRGDVESGCEGRPGATLSLHVAPARALEVQYGAAQIVERINSYFGYRAVAELRLLQMPLDAEAPNSAHPPCRRRDIDVSQPVQTDRAEASDELLAAVSDEKLRASLRRLQAGIQGT